jgi:hypothetical protein
MAEQRPQYRPLPVYTDRAEVERVLGSGTVEELLVLSLALGEHWPDWQYVQHVCLRLAEHADPMVRANACLGLAYVARTQGQLDKHLVKPVIIRELRTQTAYRWRIEDAIDDINAALDWKLARKHRRRP